MGEPKPLASLSSTLLARKGHAKPAMRPQGFGGFGSQFGGGDDLGWNDMGHDGHHPVPIHQDVHPEPAHLSPLPQVVRQREELAEEFAGLADHIAAPQVFTELNGTDEEHDDEEPGFEATLAPAIVARPIRPIAVARVKQAAKGRTAKAAFTLRVDPDRHLRLRLACAVTRESAQTIVTEALDRYLASFPEIDELARKAPRSTH